MAAFFVGECKGSLDLPVSSPNKGVYIRNSEF